MIGMSVANYLDFGNWENNDTIKAWKDEENGKNYFGELDADNIASGRGINIDSQDGIWFGHFESGNLAIGNYVCIIDDVKFRVGERYRNEEGKTKVKGKQYNVLDGTSSKFGYDDLKRNASEETKEPAKEFLTALLEYLTPLKIPELD
jgi:hypothetical protein